MSYTQIAVVIAIVLTLFNLLLTYGVIRRLRELAAPSVGGLSPAFEHKFSVQAGERVASFSVLALSGAEISLSGAHRERLFVFINGGCRACKNLAPKLAMFARAGGDPMPVVAVISGGVEEEETSAYVDILKGNIAIVVEPAGGLVHKSFQVEGYPSLCVVDPDGVVTHSDTDLTRLALRLGRPIN